VSGHKVVTLESIAKIVEARQRCASREPSCAERHSSKCYKFNETLEENSTSSQSMDTMTTVVAGLLGAVFIWAVWNDTRPKN
jgi:hypothetical protein